MTPCAMLYQRRGLLLVVVIVSLHFGMLLSLFGQGSEIHSEVRRLPLGLAMSQTRVSDIVQDDTGFLWFGTQFGLNRYDGVRVKEFFHDPADPHSIGCSYVQHLFKDRDGRLWVSCGQSFDRFNPETEDFSHFYLPGEAKSNNPVVSLLEDRDGMLWLATSNSLLHFSPQTATSKELSLHWPQEIATGDRSILSIDVNQQGQLWALTRSALIHIDPTTGGVEKAIPTPKTYQVGSLYQDRQGTFWLIAAYRLFRVDVRRGTITEAKDLAKGTSIIAFHSMIEDVDGGMWFGTENAGVIHLFPDGRATERFFRQVGSTNSLPADHITALSQDRFGDIWLGFHDSAPVVIQRNPASSETIAFQPWDVAGLKSPLVTALFELNPNSLLIGTGKATQVLNWKSHRFSEPFPFLQGMDVFDVHRDRRDRLWFATERGLYLYDPATKSQRRLLDGVDAYRIEEDHAGQIWVLLRDQLLSYDGAHETFLRRAVAEAGENYYTLTEAPDGDLWVGGSRGLEKLDPRSGHLQAFPYVGNDSGPSDPRINTLHFDAKGRLWIGTQSGLNLYLPHTAQFQRIAGPKSLGGQIISCILENRNQKLWMSSNQGLLRFDPETREIELYNGAFDGTALDLSGWGACAKGASGELSFGGFSGVVRFQPEVIGLSATPPRVALTGLLIGNQPIAISSNGPLRSSIVLSKRIDLDHTQNDIVLEFSTLDFRQSDTQRLRYQLVGSDDDWVTIPPDQHTLTFVHLRPKSYTLRIQSVALDGVVHDSGVNLTIDIAKPWWARPWMYCIYFACLCLLMWLGYRHRMKRLSDIFNARMEGRVRERTALARELHDTLLQDFQGLILRFVGITAQVDSRLAPSLDAAITQAQLSLIEGRDAIQEMRTVPVRMEDLPAALQEVAHDLNFLSAATVTICADQKTLASWDFDAEKIFPIVKEALRNALQHANASVVEVIFERRKESFVLSILDDGEGIPEALAVSESHPVGRGIDRMQEQTRRLGGQLHFIHRATGGTAVQLTLPRKGWTERLHQRWLSVISRYRAPSPGR